MTTTSFQQSDYKSNVDQTDRHLHVTSGDKALKTEDDRRELFQTTILLSQILEELKLQNQYLEEILGDKIERC